MALPYATGLSIDEYDRLYGAEKGWEYWHGEARRKPVPTYLHGLLALILGELLSRAGYFVSGESDLKVVAEWRPRPDVYGFLSPVESEYAVEPPDVVFEIQSAGERVDDKCRKYDRLGVRQVFVFDPKTRTIARWSGDALEKVGDVRLSNGVTITGRTIWSEMESRARERREPPPSRIL